MHDQTRLKCLTSGPAGLAILCEPDTYQFLLSCKLPPLVHLCRNWRAGRANILSICGKELVSSLEVTIFWLHNLNEPGSITQHKTFFSLDFLFSPPQSTSCVYLLILTQAREVDTNGRKAEIV